MKKVCLAVAMAFLLAVISASAAAQTAPEAPAAEPAAQIHALLDAQVAAWNHGDLEGYMAGYWNSPELTFFSGASLTRGWKPTLDRYRKAYQQGGREMGKLDFRDLDIQPLGEEAAFVRGRWRLRMKDGSSRHGVFTLLLRRLPEGWRIVHDHSSGG